jgi:flagellin
MAVIGTNVPAINASFYLNAADAGLSKAIRRLSSGSKIVDPADDAAGAAVSSKLDASIRRLNAASEGAANLISFSQASDGFLSTIQSQLVRMSELASRATNGAFSDSDRLNYNTEFAKLQSNIVSEITNAKFNGVRVFDTTQTISSSVSGDGTLFYSLTLANALSSVSSITAVATNILTTTGASAAITALTTALGNIATNRATVNTDVSAVSFLIQNIDVERINVQAANSRIKDLDFAEESVELAKYNILTQSSTAMLAQANLNPQNVLSLLR